VTLFRFQSSLRALRSNLKAVAFENEWKYFIAKAVPPFAAIFFIFRHFERRENHEVLSEAKSVS